MINLYSGPLIVVEATKKMERGKMRLEVLAEESGGPTTYEYRIVFSGVKAEDAANELVSGVRFTFRGIVRSAEGKTELSALTFARLK